MIICQATVVLPVGSECHVDDDEEYVQHQLHLLQEQIYQPDLFLFYLLLSELFPSSSPNSIRVCKGIIKSQLEKMNSTFSTYSILSYLSFFACQCFFFRFQNVFHTKYISNILKQTLYIYINFLYACQIYRFHPLAPPSCIYQY